MNTLETVTRSRLPTADVFWSERPNRDNQIAKSCRHAVQIRDRLGSGDHGGVPLWAELKTQVGYFQKGNERVYLAVHTRANTVFSESKIAKYLNVPIKDVHLQLLDTLVRSSSSPDTLQSQSDIFGLVNPLNIDVVLVDLGIHTTKENIVQIFDTSLQLYGGTPDTVTTNIGNGGSAFEISPLDLAALTRDHFPSTSHADIATPDPIWLGKGGEYFKPDWYKFPAPCRPKIGILTGNSPESGMTFWADVLEIYRDCFRHTPDMLMPEVLLHSLPSMGLATELTKRKKALWIEIEPAIEQLLKAGCKILAIPSNSTSYFKSQIDNICRRYEAQYVSIAESAMLAALKALNDTQSSTLGVGLVGAESVIDMTGGVSGYKSHLDDHKVSITPINGVEIAYILKNIGVEEDNVNSIVNKFRNLINREAGTVKVIILALTEISLVYRKHIERSSKKHQPKYVFIDPLRELAWQLVETYITSGFRQSEVCQIPDDFDIETFWKHRIQELRKVE